MGTQASHAWETRTWEALWHHLWTGTLPRQPWAGRALCAGASRRHTWGTAPPLCTPIIPILGGFTGTKDADSLFHDLNPLLPSSLTSSHLLPLKQCCNHLLRQAEKADLQKMRFLVRTNADTPLHMLSNYPILLYTNSPKFILINPYQNDLE